MLILVTIFEKSQFWSKLSKILDFDQNCQKISIWDKTYQNIDFSQFFAKNVDFSKSFRKMSIWVKFCKYFGRNFRKSRFWSKFSKISILGKIFENIDFGEVCPKISNMVKIIEKSRF